jgi:tricarballylate dehydrogenase
VLIGNSFEAGLWLRKHGVRFQPALGRQAFKVDGKFKFWGGLACHILCGGQHLVAALHEKLERVGIPLLYDTTASALLRGDDRVEGVRVRHRFREYDLRAKSVVLACGGFESNPEMRTRYLGPNWTWQRCAARNTTTASATAWRSTLAPPSPATGPVRMPCSGT